MPRKVSVRVIQQFELAVAKRRGAERRPCRLLQYTDVIRE